MSSSNWERKFLINATWRLQTLFKKNSNFRNKIKPSFQAGHDLADRLLVHDLVVRGSETMLVY